MSERPAPPGRRPNQFPTTRLSLVLAAADTPGTESRDALDALCRMYWYPLYVFIRRRGHDVEEARDLTQGFIASLLEKNTLRRFRRERGRFRSFLLACAKHFLSHQRDLAGAQKRGGGVPLVALDAVIRTAEGRYRLEPRDDLSPDKVFEKRWALEVLDLAMARLRDELVREGKREQFDQFKGYLTGDDAAPRYRELALTLGMTEGAVKVAVHRLRQRFHQSLREEISLTVVHPDDIGDEIRHLVAAILG